MLVGFSYCLVGPGRFKNVQELTEETEFCFHGFGFAGEVAKVFRSRFDSGGAFAYGALVSRRQRYAERVPTSRRRNFQPALFTASYACLEFNRRTVQGPSNDPRRVHKEVGKIFRQGDLRVSRTLQ